MIFHGKSAVITGSTSGIGLAIARALARGGANVMINGLGEPTEIEEVRRSIERDYSVKALYSPADMAKPAEIIAMVRQAEEAFGSVDVLVNNAGIQYVAAVEELRRRSGTPSSPSTCRRPSTPCAPPYRA